VGLKGDAGGITYTVADTHTHDFVVDTTTVAYFDELAVGSGRLNLDGNGEIRFNDVANRRIFNGTSGFIFETNSSGQHFDFQVSNSTVFKVLGTGHMQLKVLTDATRGSAGTAGQVIFNSDDGQLNIDDGTNWTLPDGTTT
jgi:hypothetical protein